MCINASGAVAADVVRTPHVGRRVFACCSDVLIQDGVFGAARFCLMQRCADPGRRARWCWCLSVTADVVVRLV